MALMAINAIPLVNNAHMFKHSKSLDKYSAGKIYLSPLVTSAPVRSKVMVSLFVYSLIAVASIVLWVFFCV